MIQHVVLFRFKPGVTASDKAVQAFHAAMLALPGHVAEIQGWQCGFNVTPDALAADYVLVASFNNGQDLHTYFGHPAHEALLADYGGLFELQFADQSV